MKHTLNHKYFDKLDTQEKLYFLGFICGDGCVENTKKQRNIRNRVSIDIHTKDAHILERFIMELGATNTLRTTKRGTSVLAINSKEMVNKLIQYGITPRKSFTLKMPIIKPRISISHFFRGLVDSDGCISKTKSNGWFIDLSGTKEICMSFLNWCKKYCNAKALPYKHENIWVIRLNGKNSAIICKKLYVGSKIHLHRKYDKAMQCIEHYKCIKNKKGKI